jgi:hypothetical protein
MIFDEWYPAYMKRGIVQRTCECIGCTESTFWRYDFTKNGERIFFAACSSECLTQILNSGIREPAAGNFKVLNEKEIAQRNIDKAFGG